MHARARFGRSGEDLAAAHLRRKGLRVVERNTRLGRGEIDLVARRGDLVVFCEVKTRTSDSFGMPSEAVGARKQAQLRRLAGRWLAERRPGRVQVRFDVVSVIVRAGRVEVSHMEDAFR